MRGTVTIRTLVARLGAWLKRRPRRPSAAAAGSGEALLREVGRRASASLQDVAARLGWPLAEVSAALADLEAQGLVRLSRDRLETNRVVAITAKGRQAIRARGARSA
ncbi:MAG TPA: helix-turn-helix domain-containing protein [Microvirga sp.]|jgi:Mn-dependent DtxR family transcriptional regulator|nr:helix-turn-helix domain-containing protein [Microvirga sp.]